jgi:hypothetical protein
MPDEATLEDKAREAIDSGRLPTARPGRILYAPSAGAACAVCGVSVSRGEMQVELEFPNNPSPKGKSLRHILGRLRTNPKVSRYHLHIPCFTAWELERLKGTVRRR